MDEGGCVDDECMRMYMYEVDGQGLCVCASRISACAQGIFEERILVARDSDLSDVTRTIATWARRTAVFPTPQLL